MAAILPGATDLAGYWENILSGKDCVSDVPEDYWKIADFYDPDPAAGDKTYAYRGGFVDAIDFDSISYGIPPTVMESISVEQMYALVVAKKALQDAGLVGEGAKPFNKDKTGVILAAVMGKNAYSLTRRADMMVRAKKTLVNSGLDEALAERVIARLKDAELEWTEDAEPGFLGNVTAGRIANRFDLGGTNCVVDAACASSLAAVKIAVGELRSGDCDIVLTGGVNLDLTVNAFISFCKTPALSQANIIRPFDAEADGMLLGDGVAMVVLKRLEDAQRDDDRIYAVIGAVGSSSDGRRTSIFAPSVEGQVKAIERAYEVADVDPASIGLIEAHGTGTFYGDECEITALNQFYGAHHAKPGSIVIGSVKSQIGHTRLAAGISGLIKAALAVYHRTLPPTINVNHERPELAGSPFHTISSPKPWITGETVPVRRAGLSSFGFGGANFHTVLEEYVPDGGDSPPRLNRVPEGICLTAADNGALASLCHSWIDRLSADPLAYEVLVDEQRAPQAIPMEQPRIGFVGRDCQDAIDTLRCVVGKLSSHDVSGGSQEFVVDGSPVYYRASGITPGAKVATLFSSQSAQYPGMFNETARDYPEMSGFLGMVGSALEARGLTPIADILYAGASGCGNECQLTNTVYSQSALAAVCGGLYEVLKNRHYTDDIVIGHSFGEITGLWAAGAIDAHTFADITVERGRAMASGNPDTGMLVIAAGSEACEEWIAAYDNVHVANENSCDQTLVSGEKGQLRALAAELMGADVPCTMLNVSHAFHSPYMKEPNEQFQKVLDDIPYGPLTTTLYSGADGKPYGNTTSAVRTAVGQQMERPVRFMRCVTDAYEAGARVFVEIGPGKVLTNLVNRILGVRDIHTIAVNGEGGRTSSNLQLEDALVQLRTLGFAIGGDLYRKTSSDFVEDDPPKSAYRIDPIVYMTPAKKQVVEEATNSVDTESRTNMRGRQAMDTRALDVVYGIQSLNGQALDKFLDSQTRQIDVFSQLMSDPEGSADVLKLMEAFQENSMRAYDSYMRGQREVLGGGTRPDAPMELATAPAADPVPRTWVAPVPQPTSPPVRVDPPGAEPPQVPGPADLDKHKVVSPLPGVGRPGTSVARDVDPVQMIVSIISEKTGYPEDMVDADMNIESDLGIDSIKRIEVFAELSNRLPDKLGADDVEALSMLHTISEIGDHLRKRCRETGQSGAVDGKEAGEAEKTGDLAGDSMAIRRFEVAVREAEPEKRTTSLLNGGVVVIVRDDSGVAEAVADRMTGMGYTSRLVAPPEPDEATIEQLFADVLAEENQPLTGFVYVGPKGECGDSLFPVSEIDALESVFLCAKYFTRSFVTGEGTGFFISASRIDGRLGLGTGGGIVQGGLFGLHKSLTVEWHDLPLNSRTLISKAVDLAKDVPEEKAADYLIEEIFTYANDAGVGRTGDGRRYETCLREAYPDPASRRGGPTPKDVILVTGGGRGITAQCVIRLAQHSHCGFVLLGRTDITADIEWAGGVRDRTRLRELAIAKLHQTRPKPSKVEALVDSALSQMEIGDTLDAIRAAGGRAHYVSCDVRDVERLKDILRDEEAQLGPITGIVHGAGILADKTIQRKTTTDFDNVFGSKVLGLDACLNSLDAGRLRYIVVFSSTSAYFGNGGQTDYSMANEVLNKFGFAFKRLHPGCTVMAVDWGLWDGGSMASDSIRNAVRDSEIVLIPPETGAGYFVDQFIYAQKPDVCQIVVNCSPDMQRPAMDL